MAFTSATSGSGGGGFYWSQSDSVKMGVSIGSSSHVVLLSKFSSNAGDYYIGLDSSVPSTMSGRLHIRGKTTDQNANALWIEDASQNVILVARNDKRIGIKKSSPDYEVDISGTLNAIDIRTTGILDFSDSVYVGATSSFGVASPTNVISTSTGPHHSLFLEYLLYSGTANMRSGTMMMVYDSTTVNLTDTTTADIGDTSPVTFTPSISPGTLSLDLTPSSGTWNFVAEYTLI
jgi:hypothetical protein